MKIKKMIAIVLVFSNLLMLSGCSSEPEKFSGKWFEQHQEEVLPTQDVQYYVIDNPTFLENTEIANTFAIILSLYQADYSITYDVVGNKFALYSIDDQYYANMVTSEDTTRSIKCTDNSELPESSLLLQDVEMIKDMLNPDYSSCLIALQEELDEENVVSLVSDKYLIYLYLDKETDVCTRFECTEIIEEDGAYKGGEYYMGYIQPSKEIVLPDTYSETDAEDMTSIELSTEFDTFLMGSMYMLQLTGDYSIYTLDEATE